MNAVPAVTTAIAAVTAPLVTVMVPLAPDPAALRAHPNEIGPYVIWEFWFSHASIILDPLMK